MKKVIDIDTLLRQYNDHYVGEGFFVNINNKEYSFIKNYVITEPRKFLHSFYNNKIDKNAVYFIRELFNGKMYIGSSSRIYKRICMHKKDLNLKVHPNSNFNTLLKETNIKNFELIIIFTDTREEAYNLEQQFVDQFKHTDLLLNIAHDVRLARLGAKNSERHIQRMRELMTGKIVSDETKKRQSVFHKTNLRAIEQHKEIIQDKRRKINVYGTIYKSLTDASNLSPYSNSFIRRRLKKNRDPNIYYITDNSSPLLGGTIPEERKKSLSEFRKTNLKAIEQLKELRNASKKKILLNGVMFSSVTEAVQKTGISECSIYKQLKKMDNTPVADAYILNYLPYQPNRILIDDIVYERMSDAIAKTGLSKNIIKYGIKNGKYKYLSSR